MSEKKVKWESPQYDLWIDGRFYGSVLSIGGGMWESREAWDEDGRAHRSLREAKAALLEKVMATGENE